MTAPLHQAPDADEPNLRARLDEAIARWEDRGPTSLTVALLAECVYAARDLLIARDADPRTHGLNHAPLPPGEWLAPGFCAGCDNERERVVPDADERIVGALAGLLCPVCTHGFIWHHQPCDEGCDCDLTWWDILAPTAARLIEDAVAERLAGVEAALSAVENRHQFHGTQCVCGYTSSRSRSRTEHITAPVRAALSGGGERVSGLTDEERETLRRTWDFGPFGTEAHQFAAVERILADRLADLTARAERAEAQVERVRGLAGEWAAHPEPPDEDYEGTTEGHYAFGEYLATWKHARDLRAALRAGCEGRDGAPDAAGADLRASQGVPGVSGPTEASAGAREAGEG